VETAYIAMGGNVPSRAGTPAQTLVAAAERLESLGRFVARSSLYSTEPVGYADQPRFVNAVVGLETELPPRALLEGLLALEKEFGRDRTKGFANGPRSLDLDIVLFGEQSISEPGLEIPHPRIAQRAFVLIPLNEIAPNIRDSRSGLTMAQLLDSLRSQHPSDTHEVVPLQNGNWHFGVDCDVRRPGPNESPGTGSRHGS
jgi:2-amino-4-hydroxy-6-hydroxymethyldihydropteridine diphosphokinase